MWYTFLRFSALLLLVGILLPCAAGPAFSALAPDVLRDAQRRQEQIQQQLEERRRMQEQDFRQGTDRPPAEQVVPVLPHVPGQEGAACMQVERVIISGATLLSLGELRDTAAPYEGRCLTVADINNLMRDASNRYIEKGYVTARVFMPPEQEEEGSLRLEAVEGRIEAIILNDGEKNSLYRGKTAFPGLVGKPLNLRDIEQGLDQLNRLPSGNASMELLPGSEMGGTVVKVTDRPRRTWRAGLGLDNLGQPSTGQYQYSASLEKDNLMGAGDQFAVYWSADLPAAADFFGVGRQIGHNQSLSAYASIPWGYWTLSFDCSRSAFDTTVFGMNTSYTSSGATQVAGARLERVLHRDASGKTSASVFLSSRDVDNFIEGVRLVATSYMLTTGGVSLSHSRRQWGGVLGGGVEYTHGLPIFGTKEMKLHGRDVPHTEFDKFTASLSWYRPFSAWEQSFYWNLTARGQFSDKTLFGAERIQVGGRSSVRGFLEDSITGDTGAYVRNEVGWNLPWFENLREIGPVRGLQLYAAYDYGVIQKDKADAYERGRMQGAALGLRTEGNFSFDLAVSKALDCPAFVDARDFEWQFSLKYDF